jgi:hypothetical protein
MTPEDATNLLVNAASEVAFSAFTILGVVLTIMVGFFVFSWGFAQVRRAAVDQSYSIGGFYVRRVPYAGYNRWRSRAWNMAHTFKE